jgi:RNA polymerase sigma-70 factor, ECF subfamily
MNQSPVIEATATHLPYLPAAMPTHRSHVSLSLVVGKNRPDTSDGDIARGLSAGETWAIAEAWHRFSPMVLMMAARALGSRSEAEDIGQVVFYCVFRKAKTLRDPNSLRSFVYSVAIRELKSELRRKRVRAWLSFHEPEELVDLGYETLEVESRDLVRKFHRLLDRLTPRDRLVFTLRHMEAMTVDEIAATMELSVSTVKRSIGHSASRLTHWIEADPGLVALLDPKREKR